MSFVISATIVTDDTGHVARALEVLARAASGLTLEGMDVALTMSVVEEDPERAEEEIEGG